MPVCRISVCVNYSEQTGQNVHCVLTVTELVVQIASIG